MASASRLMMLLSLTSACLLPYRLASSVVVVVSQRRPWSMRLPLKRLASSPKTLQRSLHRSQTVLDTPAETIFSNIKMRNDNLTRACLVLPARTPPKEARRPSVSCLPDNPLVAAGVDVASSSRRERKKLVSVLLWWLPW
jgi:hypothetical protein